MLYHSSRFMRAMISSFLGSTRYPVCRPLVHLEPAELALPVGRVPIGDYFLDQTLLADAKQEDVRQIVVETLATHQAKWFGLGARDHHLGRNVPLVIGSDINDPVGNIGERVDEGRPDNLADGAHLAVTPNDPLPAP